MVELITAVLLAFVSLNGIHVKVDLGIPGLMPQTTGKTSVAVPRFGAARLSDPPATWCYYGALQTYLRCPPAHGVKQ